METKDLIKPKAYFIDIDGTLVKGHKDTTLNVDDMLAIKRAIKNETYIILSTGRSLPDLKKIWKQIDNGSEYTRYGIVNNGSGIWDLKSNKLLSESFMDEDSFREIFEYARKHKYAVKNSLEKTFFVKKSLLSKILKSVLKTTTVSSDFESAVYNNKSAKKLGMITRLRKSKVRRIAKDIDKKFPHVDVAISGPGLYIEINKVGVSKGTALKFLCDKLEIDIHATAHIGDSMNDAPAFDYAGYGIAMGNSMKELKAKADFVTLDRKKGGVANAIRSFGNA